MKKSEIITHLVITFFYFLVLSVLRLKIDTGLVFLWLGGLLGTFLLDIDHLLYWFIIHPEKEDSAEAKALWQQKGVGGYRQIYGLIQKTHSSHDRLIFHSAVFQAILLVLAFYVVSSGGSFFGSGLIMSINLHLLKDEWQDYAKRGEGVVSNWLFWQIKGIPVQKYLKLYLIIISLIFLSLSWLLI